MPTIGPRDRLVVDTPDANRIDVALILLRLGVDEWVAVDLARGGEHKVEVSGSESEMVFEPLPEDDPKRRCPQTARAREVLGWEPRVGAREGLRKTLDWFAGRLAGRQEASSGQ